MGVCGISQDVRGGCTERASGWGRPLPPPAVVLHEDVDQQHDQDDCDERSDADVHVDLLSLASLSFIRSTRLAHGLIAAILRNFWRTSDVVGMR
jgi:hypothetical protein